MRPAEAFLGLAAIGAMSGANVHVGISYPLNHHGGNVHVGINTSPFNNPYRMPYETVAYHRPYYPMAAAPVFTRPVFYTPAPVAVLPVSSRGLTNTFCAMAGLCLLGAAVNSIGNLFKSKPTPHTPNH